MFPVDLDLDSIKTEIASEETEAESRIGRSFLFRFDTGQFEVVDGAVTECDERTAVKQWLELMCKTTLEKYKVYQGSVFGTSAETFIGHRTLPQGFVASELEREIRESAALNPAIREVGNFKIARTTKGMEIAFRAYLANEDRVEVNANV